MKSIEYEVGTDKKITTWCFASYFYYDTKHKLPTYEFESNLPISEPDKKGITVFHGEGAPNIELARETYQRFKKFSEVIFPKALEEIPQEIRKRHCGLLINIISKEDSEKIISK